jgi:hypothetical protein
MCHLCLLFLRVRARITLFHRPEIVTVAVNWASGDAPGPKRAFADFQLDCRFIAAPVGYAVSASMRSSACFGTNRLPAILTVGSTPLLYARVRQMPRIWAASSMV